MSEPILDREQVRKVAHLARLELTAEEEETFSGQLSSIIGYFEQLKELDTENVPPTTRAIDTSNICRDDRQEVFANREEILQQAPEPEGEYFKVPRILDEA